MSGYYPPGCEDIFDRETDRMNEEPEPRHTPEYPHDPQAFEKLRRTLELMDALKKARAAVTCSECSESYLHKDGCSRG